MKTQNQKQYGKFSKRVARGWSDFVDWVEDIDFEDVFLNALLLLLIGFTIWGVVHLATRKTHKDKTDSIADTVAVVDTVQTKSDTVVFDTIISDTRVVVKSNHPVKVVVK